MKAYQVNYPLNHHHKLSKVAPILIFSMILINIPQPLI
jgi:hypothetical protein